MIAQTIYWRSTADNDYPKIGGTKACVYKGEVCWFYWNPDKRTWHSVNGWRKNVGFHRDDVAYWTELPFPPFPAKALDHRIVQESWSS